MDALRENIKTIVDIINSLTNVGLNEKLAESVYDHYLSRTFLKCKKTHVYIRCSGTARTGHQCKRMVSTHSFMPAIGLKVLCAQHSTDRKPCTAKTGKDTKCRNAAAKKLKFEDETPHLCARHTPSATPVCTARTTKKVQCRNKAFKDSNLCALHIRASVKGPTCTAKTNRRKRCRCPPTKESHLCKRHLRDQDAVIDFDEQRAKYKQLIYDLKMAPPVFDSWWKEGAVRPVVTKEPEITAKVRDLCPMVTTPDLPHSSDGERSLVQLIRLNTYPTGYNEVLAANLLFGLSALKVPADAPKMFSQLVQLADVLTTYHLNEIERLPPVPLRSIKKDRTLLRPFDKLHEAAAVYCRESNEPPFPYFEQLKAAFDAVSNQNLIRNSLR